jgi:hypothetical protein
MKGKDKYKKIRRLGKGTYGKVYLVECPTKNVIYFTDEKETFRY